MCLVSSSEEVMHLVVAEATWGEVDMVGEEVGVATMEAHQHVGGESNIILIKSMRGEHNILSSTFMSAVQWQLTH
jgi:hypothetical protein